LLKGLSRMLLIILFWSFCIMPFLFSMCFLIVASFFFVSFNLMMCLTVFNHFFVDVIQSFDDVSFVMVNICVLYFLLKAVICRLYKMRSSCERFSFVSFLEMDLIFRRSLLSLVESSKA